MAKRGDAMIEFFALLPRMREMYEKKGIVVAKRMYEILINEGKITMSLRQFGRHFSENLAPQKEVKISSGRTPKNKSETIIETKEEEPGPIILNIGITPGPRYNPHRTKIDPSRIL